MVLDTSVQPVRVDQSSRVILNNWGGVYTKISQKPKES